MGTRHRARRHAAAIAALAVKGIAVTGNDAGFGSLLANSSPLERSDEYHLLGPGLPLLARVHHRPRNRGNSRLEMVSHPTPDTILAALEAAAGMLELPPAAIGPDTRGRTAPWQT